MALCPLARRRAGDQAKDAVDNVIDIGEVAGHLALAKDGNRPSCHDLTGEAVIGHVRPPPWTIDRKEPQARLRQVIEVGVGGAHQLARPLGGSIERGRGDGWVLLAKALAVQGPVAIDRTGRGIDQVVQARRMAAGLQHTEMPRKVRVGIGKRIVDRVTHPRLRGQMDDAVCAAVLD